MKKIVVLQDVRTRKYININTNEIIYTYNEKDATDFVNSNYALSILSVNINSESIKGRIFEIKTLYIINNE